GSSGSGGGTSSAGEGDGGAETPSPSSAEEAATSLDSPTPAPTPSHVGETPAPTIEGAVSQLSGSVTAPSSVLGTPASSRLLETELRDLMNLDDQDNLKVTTSASGSRRLVD
ncbi:unnamed protein product, partial [Laminaria digitata]